MIKYLIPLVLLSTTALAQAQQPTAQEQIERTIGNLFVANTNLQAQLLAAQTQITELQKQIAELKKGKDDAKQVPEAKAPDGGSSAQPEVR